MDKDGSASTTKALFGILNELQQYVGVFVGDTPMHTVKPFLESFSAAYENFDSDAARQLRRAPANSFCSLRKTP